MKLNKFAYLYSKPLGNHTLKIMKKFLEIYFKTWKNHGISEFQSEKVGTLDCCLVVSVARMVCEWVVRILLEFFFVHFITARKYVVCAGNVFTGVCQSKWERGLYPGGVSVPRGVSDQGCL